MDEKKTTVYRSLDNATKPKELECLMNFIRFVARNPEVSVPYGTVSCEQMHNVLAGYFSDKTVCTARYATTMTELFTLKQLVTGHVRRSPIPGMADQDKARRIGHSIPQLDMVWIPKIVSEAVPHERVCASDVPTGAQLPRRGGKKHEVKRSKGISAAAKRALRR